MSWQDDLVATISGMRRELHRFCARMVGSLGDGEDVVQNSLMRAVEAAAAMPAAPSNPRAWIFQIARNAAIDHLRRQAMRSTDELDASTASPDESAEDAVAREQATRCAIACFVELPAAQRVCVIAKDVLDFTSEEIGELLGLSVPAVKSALHRGRVGLRAIAAAPHAAHPPHDEVILRYARLFNQRDLAGLRAMLAEDVDLDVVGTRASRGREGVGSYFTNYARGTQHAVVAWLEGREVLAVYARQGDPAPRYFIELRVEAGAIAKIRDFVHVPYIADDARFE
ncbi:MAG: polymerase sigma-54 factor RpoN [bacterium]|nr:polymerase sigma-54 factor RpoN [bacterium]